MSRLRMGRRTEERDKYENSPGDGHDDYYGDRRELTPTRQDERQELIEIGIEIVIRTLKY